MKTNKLLRYLLIASVVLIVLAVVGKKAGWFGKEHAVKVAVEEIQRRDITETITANGKIQPETEVKISPDVSGEIVELNVNEGDMVETGQLLARIKPEVYISARNRTLASVNSAKARLAQANAQYIQSELSYKRNKSLWEEGAISEAVYEAEQSTFQVALAELDAAKYTVRSAEAGLEEAEENLIKTSIYAPMTGTVSMLLVEKGERVIGAQMMTGTEMMRIADLNRMEVQVEVNENDIVRVNLSDTAIIEVDAFLGEKFKGLVTEIANSANISGLSTDQVTNFQVKVLLLRDSYQNILSVPIQAVTTRSDSIIAKMEKEELEKADQDKTDDQAEEESGNTLQKRDREISDEFLEVVFTVKDNKAILQRVKTGIQDNNYIQISEGLEDGDEVITAPYNAISKKLELNSPVEVVDEDDLFTDKKKKKNNN